MSTYSITNDTANARVNLTDLQSEVNSSSITTQLNSISTDGDVIVFDFGIVISPSDSVILAAVLAAHTAEIPSEEVIVPVVQISSQPAFAAKTTSDGKKLFKRVHGEKYTLEVGVNNLQFTIPYPACKVNGVEILNCALGDTANFIVNDSAIGSYSGVPNYKLNQFGFSVNIKPDYHEEISNYDADLYYGMVINIEVTVTEIKDVYLNFIIHEVI